MAIASSEPQLARTREKDFLRPPTPIPLRNIDVNAEFNGAEQPILVTDIRAIRQKLMNIFSVVPGEEHFEPTWGSLIPYRLFETVTQGTALNIEFDTISAAHRFMNTDIQVLHGQSSVKELDTGDGYLIELVAKPRNSRSLSSFRFRLMSSSI